MMDDTSRNKVFFFIFDYDIFYVLYPLLTYLLILPRISPLDATLITDTQAQNFWDFGLCSSSGILKTGEHNVSETGSVSVLR
jgi:hypothetical protein